MSGRLVGPTEFTLFLAKIFVFVLALATVVTLNAILAKNVVKT